MNHGLVYTYMYSLPINEQNPVELSTASIKFFELQYSVVRPVSDSRIMKAAKITKINRACSTPILNCKWQKFQ